MRHLLILGGGTAGTMMANKLASVLDEQEWQITLVDGTEQHYYQPGFLFVPFGTYRLRDIVKPRRQYLPPGVKVIISAIDHIDTDRKSVTLGNQEVLKYDYLIIATGADIHPEQTEGLLDEEWGRSKFDFYTPKGTERLGQFLRTWQGGKLVLNIAEMPIKCPVAPLEFLFLADAYFTERGMRDKVDLHLVTPLAGAFTKPTSNRVLSEFLVRKNITVTPDFGVARVDSKEKKLVAWDDTEVGYDLLVSIPTNMGDASIPRSGLGNELNFIPTDKETLMAEGPADVFVLGDATNLPSSKAGSVAHFQSEILFQNFLEHAEGRPMPARFDGHANCFIESGFGKGLLIDFNYQTEPLLGEFPLPGVGPFTLLKESPINHYGKLMFRWVYWNVLLRGMELPIGSAVHGGKESITMTDTLVEDRIAELHSKLDFIVEEISHLKRVRNSAEDLVADLSLVGKDAMGEATEAFGTLNLRPQDVIQLFKSVLLDARLLTTALQQLESAADFLQDAQPIARDLYRQAVTGCQFLQEKGYFDAARSGIRITDALIQSHSTTDLKQVEASVPQLIGFLRELARPEVLQALEAIIHGFGRVQATMNVNKSVFEIVRDLNSQDARRGIAILVEFLKIVGARSAAVAPTN